jgi:sugar-specific transcriptional regulator TrmB
MNSLPLQTRQTLKTLGFSENEIKILLPLFQHRKLSTKELSRETTLSFDTVHYALHALELKNIVRRFSEGSEDIVEICSDQSFVDWIEQQKERNTAVYDEAKTILQMHLTNVRESSWKPNVLYFEGKQGIIDIYKDMLAQSQDIRGWTDIQKIQETIGDFMDEFIRERMEKKITSYAIMPKNPVNQEYAKKNQMRNVKFSDHLPIDGEIRIYGDKVAVITFHDEKPVGFVFSGSVITAVFRAVFEHAWQGA